MPTKLLVTGQTFCPEFLELLRREGYEVDFRPEHLEENALVAAVRDKDAYILGGAEFASARVLNAARRLKIIAVVAVGYQSYVDEKAATKRGIAITNTPHANARATAEMTIGLMFAMRRKIPFVNRLTKTGSWRDDIISSDLHGATLGVVGVGAIGSLVANIARHGLGMKILYHSRSPKPEVENCADARRVPLKELLSESDVISLHLPLTVETKNMFRTRQFQTMKRSALLINTARAQIVEPNSLLHALKGGLIAGCAMDGYYIEPFQQSENDPYGLLELSDEILLVTPHLAYHTEGSIHGMCEIAAESVLHFFEGRSDGHVVNPDYVTALSQEMTASGGR